MVLLPDAPILRVLSLTALRALRSLSATAVHLYSYSILDQAAGIGYKFRPLVQSEFDTNPTPTQAVSGDTIRIYHPTPIIKMCAFAALSGRIRTVADSSGRICTAEVRGSNPLGSTLSL